MDGSVARLEHELLPLALAHTERVVYRRILVGLYGNLTWSLIQTAAYESSAAATEATEELEAIGQRSLQPLLDSLLDADPDQQEAAVSMLGHLGNPSAAVPLLAFARGDSSPTLRARALVAAGQVADERVVGDLIEILDGGAGTMALRQAAAFGLGRIASRAAINGLVRHLESPVPSIRALACVGLGRSREARHLEALESRLRNDDSPIVQAAAAWGLGFIESDEATTFLIRALRSGPTLVRRAAAWALGAHDDQRARRELAAALFDERTEIRGVAAWALRRAGAGRLEVDSGDAYHRMPAGQLRISAYLNDLLRIPADEGSALAALTQASDQLETALDRALGGRGRPRIERVVIALRAFESPQQGRLLLAPLVRPEELEDEALREAMAPLIAVAARRAAALLDHRDASVRRLATAVLGLAGQAGGGDAVAGLLRALADEDHAVRNQAMVHLGRAGDARAIDPLTELLDAERWSVRARVVRTLGQIVDPATIEPLTRIAREDPSTSVRVEAIDALARQGESAMASLHTVIRDHEADPQVRHAACDAAREVGGEQACTDLPLQ